MNMATSMGQKFAVKWGMICKMHVNLFDNYVLMDVGPNQCPAARSSLSCLKKTTCSPIVT